MKEENALIVLAGGKSARLKGKPFIEINGRPMIKIVVDSLKGLFDEIIVVAKRGQEKELKEVLEERIVEDLFEEHAALVGIYSGLRSIDCGQAFIVSCDMPLVRKEFAERVIEEGKGFDCCVPAWPDNRIEPLAGFYRKNTCLREFGKALVEKEYKISRALGRVKTNYLSVRELEEVDEGLLSLKNVNTGKDLEEIIRLLG